MALVVAPRFAPALALTLGEPAARLGLGLRELAPRFGLGELAPRFGLRVREEVRNKLAIDPYGAYNT